MDTNYMCETKLKNENKELHQLFTNSVFCMQQMLNKYQKIFPTFTDHSVLHSMEVIDFCNTLIADRIDRLNADELYVLLMSCYLHDSGMGISKSDYQEFYQKIDFGNYFDTHSHDKIPDIIRDFHNEFSGEYIKKYAEFFEIPSKEHIFAIVQVSRGHRKTDLFDDQEYPAEYRVPGGNTICLPYLAALIRLADELDIAADRNLQFLYSMEKIEDEFSRMEFLKHQAIKKLKIQKETFIMEIDTQDEKVWEDILKLKDKVNKTLQECRKVVAERTPFDFSQKEIIIQRIKTV